jgi:acetylglutamate kinase
MNSAIASGELLVIKLGGAAADDAASLAAFTHELAELVTAGARAVLVHGGGNEVSELTRRVGLEPQFSDGIRITSPAEMPYVDMVLCGAVNKRLVRALSAAGLAAVGLSGSDGPIFTGVRLHGVRPGPAVASHTATVAQVDVRLLRLLLDHGYLPVLAPTSLEPPGWAVNINADSVALRVAPALAADRLLFLSDVPGVLKDGAVLETLTPPRAAAEIAAGAVRGGMIPKLEAAVHALEQGVRRVVIGRFTGAGELAALLTGAAGTTMLPQPVPQST